MAAAAIRTIAVYLPTAALAERLLDQAVLLAQQHGATLIGVHALPAVIVYADAAVAMSSDFIMAQQETFQEDASAVEQAFVHRLSSAGIPFAWTLADAASDTTMRAVSASCNTADLVIATQYHNSVPAACGYSPDELVLGTGRPVLIVPTAGNVTTIGQRVLVAWNGSREAARAVFDCLPLLQLDAEVAIVAVDSPRGVSTMSALTEALLRHGVRTTATSALRKEGRNVSEEILRTALGMRADLLVLGCYGHSRLRETVFGGATTRILRDMALPVLMAH